MIEALLREPVHDAIRKCLRPYERRRLSSVGRRPRELWRPHAVAEITTCLQWCSSTKAIFCLNALACVARRTGNGQALKSAHTALGDRDGYIRAAAVRACGSVAKLGDLQVLTLISSCLDDFEAGVRVAVVEALAEVAGALDHQVIAAVKVCLRDRDPIVRAAAVQALAEVCEADETVMASVCTCLEDPVGSVRAAAVGTVGTLARAECGGRLFASVCERLKHKEWYVRVGALRALIALADQGNLEAMAAVRGCRDDPSGYVSVIATEATARMQLLRDSLRADASVA
mmetsp:Transcript_64003/g.139163  ORF Transcript_64003/g.139163 Transcript_64003/m.139163 type:complete len:287 (-) Transcript_64003:50-910(-)